MLFRVYSPRLSVATAKVLFAAASVRLTSAFAMAAPAGSVTVPVTLAEPADGEADAAAEANCGCARTGGAVTGGAAGAAGARAADFMASTAGAAAASGSVAVR